MPDYTGTATPRLGWTPGGNTADMGDWLTRRRAADPNRPIPAGYKMKDGQIVRDTSSWSTKLGKTGMYAGLGAMALGGAGLAGVGPLAASGGAGGAAGAAGAAVSPTMAGAGTAGTAGVAGTGSAGGWLGTLSNYSSALAPILGAMSESRGAAQENQERSQLSRDQVAINRARGEHDANMDEANLDLDRRQFGIDAPTQRYNTGMSAAIAANARPITVGSGAPLSMPSGTITPIEFRGGDAHTLIGDRGRELANATLDQMIQAQLSGDKFNPLPKVDFPHPASAPETSILDRLISGGATASSLLAAIQSARGRRPRSTVGVADPGVTTSNVPPPNLSPRR
jgi:hypothetical protein